MFLRNEEPECNENESRGNWQLCFIGEFLAPAIFLSVSDMNVSDAYKRSVEYTRSQCFKNKFEGRTAN